MRLYLKATTVGVVLFLFLLVVGAVVPRIIAFAHIFFDHSGIPITQLEAAAAHNGSVIDNRPQLIPKIIHQVFHNWHDPGNDTVPSDWDDVRKTCIDNNPGWEYMLWTERSSREFIATEFTWFLSTYDGYRFKVQRVDAVRYFLLLHYGGIYIDLDNGCLTSLEPLLYYPMWITDGGRGALSNNILAARPQHPFWLLLTNSLIPYNYNYIFPYVTISYASGQWFETAIWEKYHSGDQEDKLHRLIMDDRPGFDTWVFFTQERGGTWINWDNLMFLWIGDHLLLFFLGLGVVIGGTVWGFTLVSRAVRRRYSGYSQLGNQANKVEDEHVA